MMPRASPETLQQTKSEKRARLERERFPELRMSINTKEVAGRKISFFVMIFKTSKNSKDSSREEVLM
jgi:hypothetical protein